MADLAAVEARLSSLLEPYRRELESATIYGMPSLRWPGAKAHDYFAAVRAGKSYVSLYLIVADTYPEALEGTPDTLLKRRSGKAAFTFSDLDDEMTRDLDAMLARLYARYRSDHAEADAAPPRAAPRPPPVRQARRRSRPSRPASRGGPGPSRRPW